MPKARKLPSGKWNCQVRKKINGQTVSKSFTAPTRKEAEFLAAEWSMSNDCTTDNLTLKEAFNRYIEIKENVLSPSTIKGYRTILRNHLKMLLNYRIDDLTQEQIQQALNIEAVASSPKTLRNINGLLSAVLKTYRPSFSFNVQLPQKKKIKMHIPTDDEVKQTLATCRGTHLEVAILLAAFGPMRRSEIAAVTSDDVIGNNIIVNKAYIRNSNYEWIIKDPKTYSSNRVITYPDFVIERIKNIKGRLVPYTSEYITILFNRHLKRNNIKHYRFHDLRHYCVSICKAMNIPDEYIMARGGWATNYTMNNVYAHTLPDVEDAVTTKILNHFSSVNANENANENY